MKITITVVTILILIIFLYIRKKSNFSVIPYDTSGLDPIILEENYNYPSCGTECVTTLGKLKPHFKYYYNDDRCFFNNTSEYLNNDMANIFYGGGYTGLISSCSSVYETRFFDTSMAYYFDARKKERMLDVNGNQVINIETPIHSVIASESGLMSPSTTFISQLTTPPVFSVDKAGNYAIKCSSYSTLLAILESNNPQQLINVTTYVRFSTSTDVENIGTILSCNVFGLKLGSISATDLSQNYLMSSLSSDNYGSNIPLGTTFIVTFVNDLVGNVSKIFINGILKLTTIAQIPSSSNNISLIDSYGYMNQLMVYNTIHSDKKISNICASIEYDWINSLPIDCSPGTDRLRFRFNNPLFVDQGSSRYEMVNNSSVYDTTVKKFGTGSIKFNGTNSRIYSSTPFAIPGDFTFQCWIRIHTVAVAHGIFEFGGYNGIVFNLGTYLGKGASINNVSCPDLLPYVPFQTWTHIAVSRAGTLVTFYVNGISRGTRTIGGTINSAGQYGISFGSNIYEDVRPSYINMDDFRLCLKALDCRYVPVTEYPSVPIPLLITVIIFGGGGGGGGGPTVINNGGGGGGGAGGLIYAPYVDLNVVGKSWSIAAVGPAGLGAIAGNTGGGATNGGDSVIISQGTELFRAFGGGAGGSARPGLYNGAAGGCGGGACGKSGVIALGGASLVVGQGHKGADSVLAGFPGGGGGGSGTDRSRYGGRATSAYSGILSGTGIGYILSGTCYLCGGGGGNKGQQYNYLLDPIHPTAGDIPAGVGAGRGSSLPGYNAEAGIHGGAGGGGATTGGNGSQGAVVILVPYNVYVTSYTGTYTVVSNRYSYTKGGGTITFE